MTGKRKIKNIKIREKYEGQDGEGRRMRQEGGKEGRIKEKWMKT